MKISTLALIVGLMTVQWAAAQTPAAGEAAPPEAAESAATAASGDATATEGEERPWQVEEETGKRYRIEKLPKVEYTYMWTDETHIRVPGGAELEVVEHDDEWFWVKSYEVLPLQPKPPKQVGPTDEELEALAASYRFELGSSDRLELLPFDEGLPRSGQWRDGFDLADMNEDGHLDIVFGPSRKGLARPNIFLGDGAGHWRLWQEAKYPNITYDYGDAEAADFNGDGHLDLAFGVHLRGLVVLVNDGSGTFQVWSEGIELHQQGSNSRNTAYSSRAIDTADWNGDGKLDLIAFGEGPKGATSRATRRQEILGASRGFAIFLNKGDGSWFAWNPLRPEETRPNFGSGLRVDDIDGDGALDLLTASSQMGSKAVLYLAAAEGKVDTTWIDEIRPSAQITAVDAADLDGDGRKDLLIAYRNRELKIWRGGVDLLLQRDGLSWERRVLFSEETRRGLTAVEAGDVDGDGRLDVVVLTGTGEVLLFLGAEGGAFTFEREQPTPPEEGCEGFGLRLADLDGDGRAEIIASFAGEPTGMQGLPRLSMPGCSREGSVRAWTTRARGTAAGG